MYRRCDRIRDGSLCGERTPAHGPKAIGMNGATIEPGRPVPLFRTRILGGGADIGVGTNYDIARDGRFLINTVLDDAASPITLLMNWKPPMK